MGGKIEKRVTEKPRYYSLCCKGIQTFQPSANRPYRFVDPYRVSLQMVNKPTYVHEYLFLYKWYIFLHKLLMSRIGDIGKNWLSLHTNTYQNILLGNAKLGKGYTLR